MASKFLASAAPHQPHSYLQYRIAGNIGGGIKFSGWPPNCYCKRTGGFKFGGSVRDRYTYPRGYVSKKFWWILIWWLLKQTAKLENLILRKIFRLYGITLRGC